MEGLLFYFAPLSHRCERRRVIRRKYLVVFCQQKVQIHPLRWDPIRPKKRRRHLSSIIRAKCLLILHQSKCFPYMHVWTSNTWPHSVWITDVWLLSRESLNGLPAVQEERERKHLNCFSTSFTLCQNVWMSWPLTVHELQTSIEK